MDNSFQWITDYQNVVELYHAESDRGAAVVAGSLVDKCLEDCLHRFFVQDSSIDELFTGYGPLTTSASKAGVAFALGLISVEMKRDLTYIRKVRNHFAHHPSEATFDVSPVRELCSNLSLAKPIPAQDGGTFQETNPRLQYLFTVGIT